MKFSVLGWLLGLPLVVLIWGLAIQGERLAVAHDLEQRTKIALDRHDLIWAKPEFNLTEGRLTGAAYSENERREALAIAKRVWGVWQVRDETALVEKAPNYVWGAAVKDDNLLLTGYVPNESARRHILKSARRQFPDHAVRDKMQPARGAPGESIWIDGIDFGLRQLMQLKQGGRVDLQGTQLGVKGEAESVTAYRTIKGDFYRRLPSGIKLANDGVKPPAARPFEWRVTYKASQVELDGHVPPGKAHDKLIEIAKQAFPKAAIVDKMTEASGAPADWLGAVSTVLRSLAQLEVGSASFLDEEVKVSGFAIKEATSEKVAHALRIAIPDSFKLNHSIAFREPTLPTISPFTTSIENNGKAIKLSGYAPDELGRQRLLASVRKHFGERKVVDEVSYANGAPAGWLTCVNAGVAGLARLDKGSASLSDAILRLVGETRDEKVGADLPAEVRAAANRACTDTIEIQVKTPPEPQIKWQAVSIDKKIEFSGSVINSAIKETLLKDVKRLFPGFEVVDKMRVDPGKSAKWEKVVHLGLEQLAKLRSGLARLDGLVLTLDGVAPDTAVATQVKARITRGIAPGYTGQAAIEVKSNAMIWSEQEAKRKSEAAATEATRKKDQEAKRQAALREVQRKAAAAAAKARAEAEAEARQREKKTVDPGGSPSDRDAATPKDNKAAVASSSTAPAGAAPSKDNPEAARKKAIEAEARRRVEAAVVDVQRKAEQARQEAARRAAERAAKQAAERRAKRLAAEKCRDQLNATVKGGLILFEVGSNRLTESSTKTLDKLIETYRDCPGAQLEIGGHTDSSGRSRENQALSQRRAEAVLDYFVTKGLPRDRFIARGYGETRPLASNQTAENRAKNRRIEFEIMAN